MSTRRFSAPAYSRATAALVSAMIAATAACADLSTSPTKSPTSNPTGGNAEVFVPTGPIVPCPDTLFKANFSADIVNAAPAKPVVGSWKLNESAGVVRVRSSLGWPVSLYNPVELSQFGSLLGGVGVAGTIACGTAPSTGRYTVRWRSLVSSTFAVAGGVAIRDSQSRMIADLMYWPNGVIGFNGMPILGLFWTAHRADSFRVDVNLDNHTTSLYVNTVLTLSNVPFHQPTASNVRQVAFELGGATAQSFAWDDIMVVRQYK
jgi:hypothetical protein